MSKNYEELKKFYNLKLWSKKMVIKAVGRWITEEEFEQITGERYKVSISEDKKNG